jgi:hypothetical protein
MIVAPTTLEILRAAEHVLVRTGVGFGAAFRPKRKMIGRFPIPAIERLAEAGLVELDPRRRWARLTELGREMVRIAI